MENITLILTILSVYFHRRDFHHLVDRSGGKEGVEKDKQGRFGGKGEGRGGGSVEGLLERNRMERFS